MKKVLIILIVIAIVFATGLIIGWRTLGQEKEVTSQILLINLQKQGFLITQSYIFNDPVTIETSTGSAFKDIFWSQEVQGQGTIQVNLGVDLSLLTQEDIKITADQVNVKIPNVTVFNSSIIGELNVENKQGIFKRLFDNDDGYNQILNQIKQNAENAAQQPELITNARSNTIDQIKKMLSLMIPDKEIIVEFI